jgi:hypothetical protein
MGLGFAEKIETTRRRAYVGYEVTKEAQIGFSNIQHDDIALIEFGTDNI